MQWLIDIVKEWCAGQGYLTQAMFNRGDAEFVDFAVGDWIADNTWREKDLSGIIPEGAKGFSAAVNIRANAINKVAQFRMHGNIRGINVSKIQTQVANVSILQDITQLISDDRIMEYRISTFAWATINFTVKSWWF